MTGIKTDLVASCHRPIICKDCMQRLSDKKVSYQVIEKTQNEIFQIKKDLYYRILSIVKKHPVGAMLLSGIVALALGTTGSICGSYIYAYLNSGR